MLKYIYKIMNKINYDLIDGMLFGVSFSAFVVGLKLNYFGVLSKPTFYAFLITSTLGLIVFGISQYPKLQAVKNKSSKPIK